MATNANRRVDAATPTAGEDTDSKSTLSELLTQWDEYQLFQLGIFYRERLTESIEGGVGQLSLMLREEGHFTGEEHEIIHGLEEKGNRKDSSTLFLSLVTGKGSETRRVMWESFVKTRKKLPKLDKILEEIQEFGPDPHEHMNIARGLSELPAELKDGDLIEYNLQPSQFLSGFLTDLLERQDSGWNVMYTFPHLTIQEFVAALAQFLTPDPGDILKRLTEAHSEKDGRFEIFLRFIAGLSSPGSVRGLEKFLGPLPHQTICRVNDWVKEEVKRQSGNTWSEAGKRSLLNTLHYLFESQNRGLAQAALGAMETLSFRGLSLTPVDCAVLSHVIEFCDTINHLDLGNCRIGSEGLQRLGPGLHKCQELRLGSNNLGDSRVEPVSAALRHPECKIQRLWLSHSDMNGPEIEHFASALTTNRSLTELDLGGNPLGDSGVQLVSAALKNPQCKIQRLKLWRVDLTVSGAEDLASALSANRSLTELDLGYNDLGDSGVKLVSAALRDPECKIQKLDLSRVGVTDSGADELVSALSTNRSLMELDLGYNELGDSGVKHLSAALRDSECKIQRLGLTCNNLTASCAEDIASALSANPSLIELKLGINELGDSGVKFLSVALSNPGCKIQRLRLDENGLTASCVEDLASALGTNSSMIGLDLSYNELGDSGVKQLSRALKKPGCKLETLRLRAVGLTAPFVRYLASAVKGNSTLEELNLGRNQLGDSGAKVLSAALRKADCNVQKLGLYGAGLTDSCTEDLATALGVNRSVRQLNLGSNSFTDQSVPTLRLLIQTRGNLQRIKLWENQFSADGENQLRSLQGSRPGLTVELHRSFNT